MVVSAATVERINARAGEVDPRRAVVRACRAAVTAVAAVLYVTGYAAAWLVTRAAVGVLWAGTAVRVGWDDAWSRSPRTRRQGTGAALSSG